MSSKEVKSAFVLPEYVKLIIGAGGIYAAFLYYGTLQEDVFDYKAADGTKFKAAWFLQALGTFAYFTLQVLLTYSIHISILSYLEAFANVIFGGFGLLLSGRTANLPQVVYLSDFNINHY